MAWRRYGLGGLLILVLCASPVAAKNVAPPARMCPVGQVDHGSGMVAHALPAPLRDKVDALRECLERHNPNVFLPREQTDTGAPHVSLLYGVSPPLVGDLKVQLDSSLPARDANALVFGATTYWDDKRHDKSVLVLLVEDHQRTLDSLHERLRQVTGQRDRFAFTPHVTLGHLRYKRRVDFGACQVPLAVLSASLWPACGAFITDRCGQTVWEKSCP